jgi:hypothetical protein
MLYERSLIEVRLNINPERKKCIQIDEGELKRTISNET